MFAVVAAIVFAIAVVLKLAGASLGRFDAVACIALGLVFLALHAAFNWPLRRP